MALGTVQAGCAGVDYGYAYGRAARTRTSHFCDSLSSAAVNGGDRNDSKVIGRTTLPYGENGVSYGMKAQYAEESTEDTPIVQVTVSCGEKQEIYHVDVSKVDPRNASQMEMFALLSYSDDKGISNGGNVGSYERMRMYADNAQKNGYWEGNGDCGGFVNGKHDWEGMMAQMLEDYGHSGIYSEYLNCNGLLGALSGFSIRFVDFDNIKFVDRTSETFMSFKLDLPDGVLKAWLDTVNEFGIDDNDMLTHLTSVMVMRLRKWQEGGEESPGEVGATIESALKAAKEALCALDYPLTPEIENSQEVQEEVKRQRAFYQSLIGKLEALAEGGGEAADADSELSGDEDEASDYLKIFTEMMQEFYEFIKSGDTEARFQIGAQSFTQEEWDRFLERFDSLEEAIRELVKERIEQEKEKAAEREALAEEAAEADTP